MWKSLEPTEISLDFIEEKCFLRFSIFMKNLCKFCICMCALVPAMKKSFSSHHYQIGKLLEIPK